MCSPWSSGFLWEKYCQSPIVSTYINPVWFLQNILPTKMLSISKYLLFRDPTSDPHWFLNRWHLVLSVCSYLLFKSLITWVLCSFHLEINLSQQVPMSTPKPFFLLLLQYLSLCGMTGPTRVTLKLVSSSHSLCSHISSSCNWKSGKRRNRAKERR